MMRRPRFNRFRLGAGLLLWLQLVAGCGRVYAHFAGPRSGLPLVNVAAQGAIPNDGVSDTLAFQTAFDIAKAQGGSNVLIPPGTWTMTDKVTLTGASNITINAHGATIQATVRIAPWWFAWQNCTNIKWHGGKFTGVETTSTCYDRHISLEGVARTITGIATDETITVTTDFVTDTCYDHGLEVGDSVTIAGSNSTPSVNGTWTVSALDSKNPRGKFKITGVNVTIAGTTGAIAGLGRPAIQSCTTGNPASPPVVTVDSTVGLVDGGMYYLDHFGIDTIVAGSTKPGPLISLDGSGGAGTRSAIDGLRTVDVLNGTTFTFTDTAATDIPTVTTPQTSAYGEVRHGIDDSPGVDSSSGNRRMGDLEGSRVFWFSSGDGHELNGTESSAVDGLLYNDTSSKWKVVGCKHTGPFTEGWAAGLRPSFNDHKQVILPNYAIQLEGGYDFLVDDFEAYYAAGAFVGGAGNPVKLTEEDQISAFGLLRAIRCEWFFDNGVYVTGRNIQLEGSVIRNGLSAGVCAKFRGFGHSAINNILENADNGIGMEGTLAEGTLDDVWGNGGAGQIIHGNTIRGMVTNAIWTDDNNGLWPRDLSIKDNKISNCGELASTLTTANLPAYTVYGERESVSTAAGRVPVKLYNVHRLEFTGNTIDDSESGGISASDQTSDGFVAFKIAENHYTAHRLGYKGYITVAGHTVDGSPAYIGTHFITGLMGDPDATPGASDTQAGIWVKTTTTHTGGNEGVGGQWTHPRNDYAVYIGNAGGSSTNGQADVTGSVIKDNTIIGSKVGFYLAGVSDCEIAGNRGFEMNGGNPSALFQVASLQRSTLRDNSVKPLGGRLLKVDSGGTYSGITESNNSGYVYSALASATAAPPLTNCVLRLVSDRNLDTSNGNRGDENILYVQGTDNIHADSWIIQDSSILEQTRIAAWCDSLTRMRFRQGTNDKRPLYKMNAAFGLGDDANTLNGFAITRFDGSNDLLRLNSATSFAQSGTIYLVAKCTSDAAALQVLLASTDEQTNTTYVRVERQASDDSIRVRLRNGQSDTESVVSSQANAWPANTWQIIRIASNGTNTTFAISDGNGVFSGGGSTSLMASSASSVIEGADGRWFGDVDGLLWRDSLLLGASAHADTEQLFFTGDVAEVLIYDGDVSASWATIEAALFAKYGDL